MLWAISANVFTSNSTTFFPMSWALVSPVTLKACISTLYFFEGRKWQRATILMYIRLHFAYGNVATALLEISLSTLPKIQRNSYFSSAIFMLFVLFMWIFNWKGKWKYPSILTQCNIQCQNKFAIQKSWKVCYFLLTLVWLFYLFLFVSVLCLLMYTLLYFGNPLKLFA